MTEEDRKASQSQSMAADPATKADGGAAADSAAKQRKKRKWDQPAESMMTTGISVPGIMPLGVGSIAGITPAMCPHPGTVLPTGASVAPIFQVPTIQQNIAATVQKLNLPKIQDELIAREIVINDSEPTIRYKLTKRQTQEEIQRCTGAVVITRGKYRQPNGLPDGEKPLYLHISAGAHLKDTAERIKAVDRAAAMVEEILKQGQNLKPASLPVPVTNLSGQAMHSFSTCVYLGFAPDPSLNIAARIRGPNDQYINHIMNETGASVILRGWGSGDSEIQQSEGIQQPLHLYLSTNNPKNLEDAKLLAENLLDTISRECGASRVSSSKVYNAVPPPHQLGGIQSTSSVPNINAVPVASPTSPTAVASVVPSVATTVASISSDTPISSSCPQGTSFQSGAMSNYGQPQSNMISQPQPSVLGGTSYAGYGGIYPQATPLQQVALALRQAPHSSTSVIAHTSSAVSTPNVNPSFTTRAERRPPQKRKFQELPVTSREPARLPQVFSLTFYEADRLVLDLSVGSLALHFSQNSGHGSEFLKPGVPFEELSARNVSTMPPPKKLMQPTSNGMAPPPPRSMPPPPPKLPSQPLLSSLQKADIKKITKKPTADAVPDTLAKLVEYGEEDDDIDVAGEESSSSNSGLTLGAKPFWAV